MSSQRTAIVSERRSTDLTAWTLIRAAHHAERELTRIFASHQLTPVQFGVLANLAATESQTQAQLAERVLVRPQTIAGVIETMVARGLVSRGGERRRGRANPITLTSQEQGVLTEVWPEVHAANGPSGLGVDRATLNELNTVLHRLLSRSTRREGNDAEG